MRTIRKRIFQIIQIGSKGDALSRVFDIGLVVVIVANILVMFLETFEELAALKPLFGAVENVTVAIFCVEYVLRIWTADLLYPGMKRWKAVLRFLGSFDGIVDLLTILPFFYLSGFVVFRMLRAVRIFHLFRINAQYDNFHLIVSVLVEKKKQILSSLFIIMLLMLASSLGIYSAEHKAQPEVFKNAFSGIWWSVSTLLTVGYGDIYPVTVVGRVMAILVAFLGVGAVAIPTGIISAGFVEQYTKKANSDRRFRDVSKVGEISVSDDSGLAGKTVAQIEAEYSLDIYLVLRGELTVVPNKSLKIRKGDILIVRGEILIKDE